MPVPSVAASNGVQGAASSTGETAAFTGSGTNRVLYAGIVLSDGSPGTVSACKWGGSGGTSMTQIYDSGVVESFLRLFIFRLIAPATGSNTVHATFSASMSEYTVIGAQIQDCDQTTPNGTIVGANGNGITPDPTVTVSSAVTGLVLDFIGRFTTGDVAEGAGQTLVQRFQVPGVLNSASSTKAGAASVATSWSGNVSGTPSNYQWVMAGIPLNEVSAGGGGGTINAATIIPQLNRRKTGRFF